MRHLDDETLAAIRAAVEDDKLTYREVAQQLNLPVNTVRAVGRRLGLAPRPKGRPRTVGAKVEQILVGELGQDAPTEEVAKVTGASPSTVRLRRRELREKG